MMIFVYEPLFGQAIHLGLTHICFTFLQLCSSAFPRSTSVTNDCRHRPKRTTAFGIPWFTMLHLGLFTLDILHLQLFIGVSSCESSVTVQRGRYCKHNSVPGLCGLASPYNNWEHVLCIIPFVPDQRNITH